MRRTGSWTIAAALLVAAGAAACRTAAPEPAAAPPVPATPAPAPSAAGRAAPGGHEADVRFVQHMMAHHAQALAMTALVPARSARDDLRLLAERIEVSQRDELAIMRQWLESHGQPVPDASAIAAPAAGHAQHGAAAAAAGHAEMPGMLTAAEMARLAAATGADFDRLFLQLMIRHHEGALTMVAELLGSRGGAQQSQIYQIAVDVDADQRAEIQRMRALLARMPAGTSPD
jgi:uncharacterized protein (DUF305 family)